MDRNHGIEQNFYEILETERFLHGRDTKMENKILASPNFKQPSPTILQANVHSVAYLYEVCKQGCTEFLLQDACVDLTLVATSNQCGEEDGGETRV